MHRLRRAPLVAACVGFAALLAAPAANAASVDPIRVAGNPACPDGYTSLYKFEGSELNNGTTRAGITLSNVNREAGSFDWSSTVAVDLVIVKGGTAANLYFYPFDKFGDTNLVTPINEGDRRFGLSHVEFCTDNTPENPPPPGAPGIDLVKVANVSSAPAGSPVEYTFTVTNTGDVAVAAANVVLTDTKCNAGTLVRTVGDAELGPDEVWTYSCVATIPAGTTGTFVNVAEVCIPSGNPAPNDKLCDSGTTTVTIPPPGQTPGRGIDLVKTASVTSAAAGSAVTYTFTVKNTGEVTFTQAEVVLTDAKCDAGTLVRTNGDAGLSPDETWTYTCTATIPAGTTGTFVNNAEVCVPSGLDAPNDKLCDQGTTTVTVTPPTTTTTGTPPAGETPGGGALPETAVSGRARLRGPSGCVKQAFTARVSGREIASVAFFVDGKLVKRITGERSVYSVKIRPNAFGFGRHRVVARVTFSAESGTAARRLPLTFRRCAQGAVAPRFTG